MEKIGITALQISKQKRKTNVKKMHFVNNKIATVVAVSQKTRRRRKKMLRTPFVYRLIQSTVKSLRKRKNSLANQSSS